ncbi:ADP-ribosylation factor guanine nucleotide-exchange factor 1(brefeldin A-inhibited), partial [Trypanosoma conorhini]
MFWRYEEVTAACGKALTEERNGRRRFLLNVIAKDLAEIGSIVRKESGQNVHETNGETSSEVDKNNEGFEERLLSRLGFATQLVLVENCGTRLSSKGLITILEFATVLLNSGLIPTALASTPPEISIPESTSGRTGDFFSKLLGGGAGATRRSAQSTSIENATAECEVKNEAVNVFTAVVEGVLVIAQHIEGRDVNDQLLFTLVTALQASTVPASGRTISSEKPRDDYNNYFLAVQGDVLLHVVEGLFGVFKRNNVIFPLVEEVKSALNCIAKTLSKAIEFENTELRCEGTAADVTVGRGYQSDAARILEYCCSLTTSSE